jgi:glycosyltransferase involved in cell wall biosynthesis
MISVITPTADRPVGFALCERFIARQTMIPDEWIVADGGQTPARCTMGQVHIHEQRPPGAANFAHNLLNGIKAARGDVLIVCEDDDWLAPDHIATLAAALDRPGALLAGDDRQNYYNVAHRCHRSFANVGASLCQTAMKRGALGVFEHVIRQCLAAGKFGIDRALWEGIAKAQWSITGKQTCIGIKGLPGQAGLGIGHRPAGLRWQADPDLAKLREWIGDDADAYAEFAT